MDRRYEKGDLVTIKEDVFSKDRSQNSTVGIVVDIITRSTQNPDWDKILVYMDGWMDAFSPRRLLPYKPSNKSTSSVN